MAKKVSSYFSTRHIILFSIYQKTSLVYIREERRQIKETILQNGSRESRGIHRLSLRIRMTEIWSNCNYLSINNLQNDVFGCPIVFVITFPAEWRSAPWWRPTIPKARAEQPVGNLQRAGSKPAMNPKKGNNELEIEENRARQRHFSSLIFSLQFLEALVRKC